MRAVVILALLGSASVAHAQATDAPPPLKVNVPLDLTITGVGAAAWLSSELLFKHQLAPATCRWCDRDAAGNDTLNAFDRNIRDDLVWHNPHTADVLSNVSAFALLPAVTLGGTALAAHHAGANANIGKDLLVVGEATILAQDANQIVKFAVGRERPFVHRLPEDQKSQTAMPDDNNLSFFSGHTTWAFSMATAAGTVCSMHGYKYAPWVWAGGLTVATGTALLRIGADKHYATDVITGAIVGTAFGIGVPRIFHQVETQPSKTAQGLSLSLGPSPAGPGLGISGQF
ncbi:MAG: phosphatase PAP2 family protein [Deltaproteobacteria bacterium]|nr:phosphatase PAP2 family protein [Deltaproteobacteria bacterium]